MAEPRPARPAWPRPPGSKHGAWKCSVLLLPELAVATAAAVLAELGEGCGYGLLVAALGCIREMRRLLAKIGGSLFEAGPIGPDLRLGGRLHPVGIREARALRKQFRNLLRDLDDRIRMFGNHGGIAFTR